MAKIISFKIDWPELRVSGSLIDWIAAWLSEVLSGENLWLYAWSGAIKRGESHDMICHR